MKAFSVRTHSRAEFVDISRMVQETVSSLGAVEGVCVVFVPHTTAGVTINENADPSVARDILDRLSRVAPLDDGYAHSEGNSDAHIKASMMGSSVQTLVEGGRIVLGAWQGIFLCEFDGPRTRQVYVTVR